jgi:hypothetical protein
MSLVFEPSETTHWKNLHPAKSMLLGSHNLNQGEELVAKIQTVSVEAIKDKNGKDEEVAILRFYNAPPMVLNITNSRSIACMYGDLYEHWIDKSVQLFATEVRSFGAMVTALRIRETIPQTDEDTSKWVKSLNDCKSIDDLKSAFTAIPKHLKPGLIALKDKVKGDLS